MQYFEQKKIKNENVIQFIAAFIILKHTLTHTESCNDFHSGRL